MSSSLPARLSFLRRHRGLVALLSVGIVLPLFLFWKIAEDVYKHGGFRSDRLILAWLHAHSTPTLDLLALRFSSIGGPVVMAALGLLITLAFLIFRQRRSALFFLLSLGGAVLLNVLVKIVVQRQRPDLWISLAPESDFSFPSGHAMGSVALAAALTLLAWQTRWRWPVLIVASMFALLVCWSRSYLGVHYPSDILAGMVASLAWVGGLQLLFSKRRQELLELFRRKP